MPLIRFKCTACQAVDTRVAGPLETTAVCAELVRRDDLNMICLIPLPCGGLMLRLAEDDFKPYFDEVKPCGTGPS